MTEAHPLRGALLFITALLLLACMDTTTKFLAATYNVPSIVASRYIVNLLLMVALFAPTQGRQLIETQRTGLVIVRALCLASASVLVSFALQRMPVAETISITFLAPILVVVAGPLLGEHIGRTGWLSALLGFGGVLLIVRPGSGLESIGVACALAAVGANLGYQLLSRILVPTERTIALLFYTALVGAFVFGMALPWFWEGRVPTLLETVLLLSLGVYGGLGHFLFTAAFRYAPRVAPRAAELSAAALGGPARLDRVRTRAGPAHLARHGRHRRLRRAGCVEDSSPARKANRLRHRRGAAAREGARERPGLPLPDSCNFGKNPKLYRLLPALVVINLEDRSRKA